jgi:hypothetical protein
VKVPKEYITLVLTAQNLINDGYKFEDYDEGLIEVIDSEGNRRLYLDQDFKLWILEKAYDY